MSSVAKEYASALFGLSFENGTTENVRTALNEAIVALDEAAYRFFANPAITKDAKKAAVEKSFTTPMVKHLFYVLIDNRRVDLLPDIVAEYATILASQNQLLRAIVYSKTALDPFRIQEIKTKLEGEYRRPVELLNTIDATIIAGIRIEFEGYVHDQTVNRYLADLRSSLKQ